jgi:hypothetical protein
VILIDSVAKELAEKIHSHLSRHPNGEIKGVLAAIPLHGKLVGFKSIITLKSSSSSVTMPEAEGDLVHELTEVNPGAKFILFHSHPDWIPHYSGGDHTNYLKLYNGTDGYCDLQLLFHRTERKGVTMKTYAVSRSGVELLHDGMNIISRNVLESHFGSSAIHRAEENISRIARRHGFA